MISSDSSITSPKIDPTAVSTASAGACDVLQAADKTNISKAEIAMLPLIKWDGLTRIVVQPHAVEKVAKQILLTTKIIGFDTETRPCFKKGEYHPTALIQIATASTVFLFPIHKTMSFAPLIPVFEHDGIVKCGASIVNDFKELKKIQDFEPQNLVDLGEFAADLDLVPRGLRSLTALLMRGRISKKAQMSNWERHLTPAQISYAATDAWVSREIYLNLMKLAEACDSNIVPEAHSLRKHSDQQLPPPTSLSHGRRGRTTNSSSTVTRGTDDAF